ncbi:hypothetical protein [Lentzea pudingi]|nr:hypothetical protein [Lentzea pudingi]
MKIGRRDAWMFDLTARDDVVRGRALARHRALVETGTGVSRYEPDEERTIFWYVATAWDLDFRNTAVSVERWPFMALYLRWEGLFPDEWRSRGSHPWSPWSMKEGVLEHLRRNGTVAEVRQEAADLLIDAIHRSYRCKDWMYASLVHHVADTDFRDRLTILTGADDPLVRLRARFLLDLADRPEVRVKRHTWGKWLDSRT